MVHPFKQVRLSGTDSAFELLQTSGHPMHYRELIEAVLHRLELTPDPEQISAVLTQINLDTRFAYSGQGEWGLKVWVPSRGTKRLPTITLMNKSVAYDDETEKAAGEDQEDSDDLEVDDSDEDILDSEDVLEEEGEGDSDEEAWE
ncbi:MAG: DNA-directed RNA polymerase subunit delta [Desulfitobacteriaceae bacterium]